MTITTTDPRHAGFKIPALPEKSGDTISDVAANLQILATAGLLDLADPAERLDATRMVARNCAATAWLLAEMSEARDLLAAFSSETIAEVDDARIIIARLAEEAFLEGGDETRSISGTWHGVGGAAHADWILLLGLRDDAGKPAAAMVRRDQAVCVDYPYYGGLRGAGWHNIVIDGLSVPAHRWACADRLAGKGLGANRMLGVALGSAEGGYHDSVTATRARITGIGGFAVANFTQVQARLAESDAELRGASGSYEAMKMLLIENPNSAHIERDRAYLARKSLDAVTRLVRQMGAMGLAETNPVQRRYRDIRAVAADPSFAWDASMAHFGRELLGIAEPVAH